MVSEIWSTARRPEENIRFRLIISSSISSNSRYYLSYSVLIGRYRLKNLHESKSISNRSVLSDSGQNRKRNLINKALISVEFEIAPYRRRKDSSRRLSKDALRRDHILIPSGTFFVTTLSVLEVFG